MIPKRRIYVTYGLTTKEVYPYNRHAIRYTWERERDQIFKRKKLAGELIFVNNNKEGIDDFDFFRGIEFSVGGMCNEIKIEVKVLCGDFYVSEWKGYFSTGMGKFQLDECTFNVTPLPDDKYRCILDNWNRKFNMFDYATHQFQSSVGVTYESVVGTLFDCPVDTDYSLCCDGYVPCNPISTTFITYGGASSLHTYASLADTAALLYPAAYTSPADMLAKKWCIKTNTVTNQGDYFLLCVDSLVSGGTWTPNFSVGDIIDATGFGNSATICGWYRENNNPAHFPPSATFCLILTNITDPSNDFCGVGNQIEVSGTPIGAVLGCSTIAMCSVSTEWESELFDLPCIFGVCSATPAGAIFVDDNCATTGKCKYRRCPISVTAQEYRGIFYTEMIDGEANSRCDIDLSSIFFEYNPDTSDPHYVAGVNYVTGLASRVLNVMISHQSDIIDPNASDPATIGMLTLKQLLDWAREVYECFWDIQTIAGNTVIRLEHYSFFGEFVVLDLTLPQFLKYIENTNSYDHLQEDIPQYEKWKWQYAATQDFIGDDIIYSLPCAKPDAEVTHLPEKLSTDFDFLAMNATIPKEEGFVMTNPDLILGNYVLHAETGLLSVFVYDNAHLSWANLHYNYHRHNRYLQQGNMNAIDETFFSWKPNVKQIDLKIVLCCDEIIDPEGFVRSTLGDIFDAIGFIQKMEQAWEDDVVTLTLLYSV